MITPITLVLLLSFHSPFLHAAHIGLFASTGCYSHDMLMRNLAERLVLTSNHRVTIIQVRVYEFNRSFPSTRAHFDYVTYSASDSEAAQFQSRTQRLMWLKALPFDPDKFDVTSLDVFDRVHTYQMRACFKALRDEEFTRKIRALHLDLLVLDHVINECGLGFFHRHMPSAKLAYFSNYPLVSSYLDSYGVSSNPSYVPSVIGGECNRMNVIRRTINTILHSGVFWTRWKFYRAAQRTFRLAIGHELPGLGKLENRMLVFGTPMEMLVDAPRPLVGGLKYFGCEHCGSGNGSGGNISQLLHLPPGPLGYIVVSFGTLTNGEQIPLEQLVGLWRLLANFPDYSIIWQLDTRRDTYERAVLRALNTSALPPHVHTFAWVPLRRVLADERVALAMAHGGISTCMEAVRAGVPVLGLAIQGDQQYNLRRMQERGVAQFTKVSNLDEEEALREKMREMLRNNRGYKQSALKLRAMLEDHKRLESNSPSTFWLNWSAKHFASKESSNWAERLVRSKHSQNWLVYYNLDLYSAALCVVFVLVRVKAVL